MSRRRRKRRSMLPAIFMSVAVLMVCSLLIFLVLRGGNDEKDESKQKESNTTPVIAISGGDTNNLLAGNDMAGAVITEEGSVNPDGDGQESAGLPSAEGNGESLSEDGTAGAGQTPSKYENGQEIPFDPSWEYAGFSKINSGTAKFYAATENRKGIIVGINAGHGTKGGANVKTYCHPDMTPKVTGGSTAAGSIEAVAVSGGMSFSDGTPEAKVNLKLAQMMRDQLLQKGYDVLMIRDGDDVQLDNIARTLMCNNVADCHIAIHFDGDGAASDKGCFYISVPDGIKSMPPVDRTWQMSEELGSQIITALGNRGLKIYHGGSMDIDLTQTSYSSVPSVDVEFGNQSSDISDSHIAELAAGAAEGVDAFFLVAN